jgi:AcrR family transcriptional regulator
MNTAIARKRPRQDRAKATVDALVEATARLLVEEGWDGTSTNKIAAKAGVSVGSLYQYFEGKEQLVIAVGERHHQQLMAVIAGAAAGVADKELPEMVDSIIGAMLEAHALDAELHRVLSEQIPSELIMSRIEEDGAAFLYGVFETQRHKIRRDIDVDAAVFVLTHAVEGVTHAAAVGVRHKKLKDKRVRHELARMVTAYLLPSP